MSKKRVALWITFSLFLLSLLLLLNVFQFLYFYVSLVAIPIGITCSAVALKVCAITAWIKKYKSVIKKKKKKHDKIVLLTMTKLNTIEFLISNALIDSHFNHDKLVSVNVLREYSEMKEEIKYHETSVEHIT